MNALKNVKTYVNNLNERDRRVLVFGGVCVFFLLIYLIVFAPLLHAKHFKSQQLLEKQETLAWMQKMHQQHHTLNAPQVLTTSKLLTILAERLNATSFHRFPYQLQQTGTGNIQLSFDNVPYNAFINWLWSLREKYAFSIEQLSAERTQTPGVVKLILIIH